MVRRIVVFPLPDAPSKTNVSPSATSKVMFSRTGVVPNRLLRPMTLAAMRDDFGASSVTRSVIIALLCCAENMLARIQPVAGKEEHGKNQERQQSKHDR